MRYIGPPESACYHEAGHAVVAAVQGIPLGNNGIEVDALGDGGTYYDCQGPTGLTNLGNDPHRERSIVSLYAGLIAQQQFDSHCHGSGGSVDRKIAEELLAEMYEEESIRGVARGKLEAESRGLVEKHWPAIQTLASSLWNRPWTPYPPSPDRKQMNGTEVVAVLQGFHISDFVCHDSDAVKQ